MFKIALKLINSIEEQYVILIDRMIGIAIRYVLKWHDIWKMIENIRTSKGRTYAKKSKNIEKVLEYFSHVLHQNNMKPNY